jgi:hypothetical protein
MNANCHFSLYFNSPPSSLSQSLDDYHSLSNDEVFLFNFIGNPAVPVFNHFI